MIAFLLDQGLPEGLPRTAAKQRKEDATLIKGQEAD